MFAFSPSQAKTEVAANVCSGSCNSPPGCCDRSSNPIMKKSGHTVGVSAFCERVTKRSRIKVRVSKSITYCFFSDKKVSRFIV